MNILLNKVVRTMSYVGLAKKIINNEVSDEELIECLKINNVAVLQQTILKLVERKITNDIIFQRLVELSGYMDMQFKVLGLCKLGHLAIFALGKLGYSEEFQKLYSELSEEEREPIEMLQQAF